MKTAKLAASLLVSLAALAFAGCARTVGLHYAFALDRPEAILTHSNVGFRSGDRFRLQVIPEQDCFIYILHQGVSGSYSLLFPRIEVNHGANFFEAGKECQVPSAGWIRVDNQPGIETLFVLACRGTIAEAESLRNRQLTPEDVKRVLKAVDTVYNIRRTERWNEKGRHYRREIVKCRAHYPVLKCEIDITHEN